jgi:hypothetical protein
MSDEIEQQWYPTERGATIGQLGPEDGYVLRDEEFGDADDPEAADARLTLEQGRADKPGFFVTAQLYGGWLYLVAVRAESSDADGVYDALRTELEGLAGLLPFDDDRDITGKVARLNAAIAALEAQYPG